jgi:F-type H+-transporting ATPase subunit b
MFKVSDRSLKIAFSLTLSAVLILLVSAGFASEGGEGAHHASGAAQLKDFGWRVFNFVVLAGIIGFALGKVNVKGALADRISQIAKSLKEAQEAKAAAEARLREYDTKLEQATKEIDEIYADIIREAEQEKAKIILEARKAAEKIAAQAVLSAEQETLKARAALQAEAGRLAVELATGKLAGAVTEADHARFIGEYLDKVEQLS